MSRLRFPYEEPDEGLGFTEQMDRIEILRVGLVFVAIVIVLVACCCSN